MRTDELISVREYLTTDYSPDERLNDYLHFGVPYIFLLDPCTRKAHRWTAQGLLEVTELRTENPEMVVPLEALFE